MNPSFLWRRCLGALFCAAASASGAHAQTAALSETVVTATRSQARADDLVSEVVTIDRTAIEQAAGLTLPQLLAREAGLQFFSYGGRGQIAGVSIRGGEPRHTLLLVDGVRYGSAAAGTPIWSALALQQIERIEVLKGPASSLYGADALGGVVQVFTRRGRAGFQPTAAATVGSRGLLEAAAGVSAGVGRLDYALHISGQRDGGDSATNPRAGAFVFNPDRDAFSQGSVSASLGWKLNEAWRLDAGLLHSEGVNHYDDGPQPADTRDALRAGLLRLGVQGRIQPGWTTQLRFARSNDVSHGVEAAFLPLDFRTTQDQWMWQNDVQTPWGLAVAGLEHVRQGIESSVAYTQSERAIASAFAGLNGAVGAHSWQANIRRDSNSQFGGATTGFVGYGYAITPAWRLHASGGTSFVAPSFNQLYYPGFANPDLQPERGRSAELGLHWKQGEHQARMVHYQQHIRDSIASSAPLFIPQNVQRARIQGWTLAYDGRWLGWDLRASADVLRPLNETTGLDLLRRARRQASLGADRSVGAWRVGLAVLAVGDRFDDVANTLRTPSYATLDLTARYAVNAAWTLQAAVNNATDRRYDTVRGYNADARRLLLTLRYAPRQP